MSGTVTVTNETTFRGTGQSTSGRTVGRITISQAQKLIEKHFNHLGGDLKKFIELTRNGSYDPSIVAETRNLLKSLGEITDELETISDIEGEGDAVTKIISFIIERTATIKQVNLTLSKTKQLLKLANEENELLKNHIKKLENIIEKLNEERLDKVDLPILNLESLSFSFSPSTSAATMTDAINNASEIKLMEQESETRRISAKKYNLPSGTYIHKIKNNDLKVKVRRH